MEITAAPQLPYGRTAAFVNILRSEYCKLRSVRSTLWALLSAVVFNVVVAALLAVFVSGRLSAREQSSIDSVRLSLGGLHLSQVAIGVLGVLVITSEYGTGLIRATLSAVPQRRLVLAAKAIVFAGAALVVAVASSFAAFFLFQALRSGDDLKATLGEPGVLRAVIGGGLYPVVLGLFGLGLGAIIRSSAGAVAALLGALFVPPLLADLLPHSWQTTITPYVPMESGGQIFIAVHRDPGSLSAWTGFGVLCLYAATALAAGFFLIKHRDA